VNDPAFGQPVCRCQPGVGHGGDRLGVSFLGCIVERCRQRLSGDPRHQHGREPPGAICDGLLDPLGADEERARLLFEVFGEGPVALGVLGRRREQAQRLPRVAHRHRKHRSGLTGFHHRDAHHVHLELRAGEAVGDHADFRVLDRSDIVDGGGPRLWGHQGDSFVSTRTKVTSSSSSTSAVRSSCTIVRKRRGPRSCPARQIG